MNKSAGSQLKSCSWRKCFWGWHVQSICSICTVMQPWYCAVHAW